MKTNVVMTRKMGGLDVLQRTQDGMFNATTLLYNWNKSNPEEVRYIDNFWKSTHLDKLMAEIAEHELNFTSVDFTDLKNALSRTSKARVDRGGGTWMHPFLFIKFAMYLSPKFEYQVIKFVYDELIKNRHLAGDNYKLFSATASVFPDCNYAHLTKGLNWIVFNKHHKDIRNTASYEQLNELHKLEEKLCFAIDMGMIRNFPQLIETMRKMWRDRWCRF